MADGQRSSLAGALRGALFYYGRLVPNGYQAVRELREALGATPDERVLDFACGSGGFCLAVPGDYLGIDLSPHYIAFARWRWGSARRRFETIALEALDPALRFDRAMMVNCLHHLADDEARAVLGRLACIVRRRLVVVDPDPATRNWVQRFLLANDRGSFVRSVAEQRALLAEHFTVVGQRSFEPTLRTVVQALYVCEPRDRPGGSQN